MAAPCSQWIARSPVLNGIVCGRSTTFVSRHMDEWGRFLFQIASWTVAVVAAFEGARRIANGQRNRTAIILVTGGVLWCVAYGVFALYVSESMAQIADNPVRFRQLPRDSGSELSSNEREKASLAYISTAFRDSRQLFEY